MRIISLAFSIIFFSASVIGNTLDSISGSSIRGAQDSFAYLNGERASIFFNDGDTFRVKTGKFANARVRLSDFNALESYGLVHQWGAWTTRELYKIASDATKNARHGEWHCEDLGEKDPYERMLMRCADLTLSQVFKGFGHIMSVTKAPVAQDLIRAQEVAISEKKGMWAKGTPKFIVTSLHSAQENPTTGKAYDRLVSTDDGHSEMEHHNKRYETCEKVCYEHACMTYVPFEERYGIHKAECLKTIPLL